MSTLLGEYEPSPSQMSSQVLCEDEARSTQGLGALRNRQAVVGQVHGQGGGNMANGEQI